MTRFGVMKHLRVLEAAGLVISRREGREKMHFLNAVPIRLIHDRRIDKFTERQVSANIPDCLVILFCNIICTIPPAYMYSPLHVL